MNQITGAVAGKPSSDRVWEAAQRNPNIGVLEGIGGIGQAVVAAPLVAGEAPLALRALASVIDPQTGLPSLAGPAARLLRGGEATAGAGHLAAPVATEVADASGQAVKAAESPANRFYHGTSGDFAKPDAARFEPNGLFGPGYYLTDDARVAGGIVADETVSPATNVADAIRQFQTTGMPGGGFERGAVLKSGYAQSGTSTLTALQADLDGLLARKSAGGMSDRMTYSVDQQIERLQQQIAEAAPSAGPNVRAVDVPQSLNLLNADERVSAETSAAIADALRRSGIPMRVEVLDGAFTGASGADTFGMLKARTGGSAAAANKVLSEAGFDGIKYAGGQRVPMTDATGNAIEHTAVNVFPESLNKLRNAVSGRQGGQVSVRLATTLGGAAAGGGAANLTTGQDDPNRILKIAGATLLGGAAGYAAPGAWEHGLAGDTGKLIAAKQADAAAAAEAARRLAPDVAPPPMPGTQAWTDWVAAGSKMPDATALPGIPPPVQGAVTGSDLFRAYHTGNVISGLATMTHVAVNSILAPAWSFTSRSLADLATLRFDRVRGATTGLVAGYVDSGAAFARAMSDHFADPRALFNRPLDQAAGGLFNNPIGRGVLRAQSVPFSLHGAFQAMAQSTVEKVETGRLAGEEASRLGLVGKAWTDHVASQIRNPGDVIAAAAQGVAARVSLRGDLGTMGTVMQKIAAVPYVGNTLFPVVKIAANSLSQGIERSPLGLLGTGFDLLRAAKKVGPYVNEAGEFRAAGNGIVAPLQERFVNNVMGTALTFWLANKAMDGTITGAGPSDFAKRSELTAQGWQANSVWVPGRGYVDYHALGALAIPFSLAGSYVDAINYGGSNDGTTSNPEEIASSMFEQMGKYLEDQTGMRTIGQMYDVFHPQGGGSGTGTQFLNAASSFGASMLGGFVPESALTRGLATTIDPFNRKADPGNIGQSLTVGIPFARETLPVRQDVLGRPEENPQAGMGVFSPRTGTGSPDPMFKVLTDAGVSIPPVPKTVSVGSGYSVALTYDEQKQYATLRGQYLQQVLKQMADTPGFAKLRPEQQKPILQNAFAEIDAATKRLVVSQIPNADLGKRAQENAAGKVPVPLAVPSPLR